jgi:hypothetical protein
MFIPVWILVLIGLLALLVVPAIRGLLLGLLVIAAILGVLGSGAAGAYFWATKQTTLALVWGAPFLALMLWFVTTESVKIWDHQGRLNTLALRFHVAAGNATGGLAATERSRRRLAERAGLGYRLFKFYEGIKHFKTWYARSAETPDFWRGSAVIARKDLDSLTEDDRQRFGLGHSHFGKQNDSLGYRFLSRNRPFIFSAEQTDVPDWHEGFDSAYLFHVLELPSTVVLKLEVVVERGQYADTYRAMHLHVFRPGPWFVDFLRIVERRHLENEAYLRSYWKAMDEKRVRENFL